MSAVVILPLPLSILPSQDSFSELSELKSQLEEIVSVHLFMSHLYVTYYHYTKQVKVTPSSVF